MSNAIVPQSLSEVSALAVTLSKASLLPAALRGKEADVLMTIMAGMELGLAPMQALRLIHIIEGRPAMAADLIAGLCVSKADVCEYLTCTESTPLKAVYETKRKGSKPVTLAFSMEQAKAAGLTGKQNWQRYPDAMLRARAVTAVCRAVYPDLVGGLYDPDELEPTPAPVAQARPVIDTVATAVPMTPPKPAPQSPPRRQLVVESDPLSAEVEALRGAIWAAKATGDLLALTSRLKALPEAERKGLRPVYDAKLKAITQAVEVKP